MRRPVAQDRSAGGESSAARSGMKKRDECGNQELVECARRGGCCVTAIQLFPRGPPFSDFRWYQRLIGRPVPWAIPGAWKRHRHSTRLDSTGSSPSTWCHSPSYSRLLADRGRPTRPRPGDRPTMNLAHDPGIVLGNHPASVDGRCSLTSARETLGQRQVILPLNTYSRHPCSPASGSKANGRRACGTLGWLASRLTAPRGQRRGQKGWNRSAPAATGADSRAVTGADTEIRTQDLLFTNLLTDRR